MKRESIFQKRLKDELEVIFPGCLIKRNTPDDLQGFPDITVFYKGKYAQLECKRYADAPHRPNQDYYIKTFNSMGGYAAFIYPENKDQVIKEMKRHFGDRKG